MTELELRFLGDLEVTRDGKALPLPPSRKTRALLAYLALNGKPFRREHLCELLWDIPDDPRGSLRWSLSKLRRLVDDGDCCRIVADRLTVGFDATGVMIDVEALKTLVDAGLDDAPLDALETAVARYRGNFLEGLELANFHDFQAWCVAERERATRAQASLLSTLVRRLADSPERALPHARALAGLLPYDEAARATLIRLLVGSGRADEAEQQYQLGARLLKEVGAEPTGALYRARRGAPGAGSPARPVAHEGPEPRRAPAAPAADSLVGRDAELARLEAAFAALTGRGGGRLVLVRGEPGIGKSRLLRAAADMARSAGACLLEACAYESEAIRPFALWIDALRTRDAELAAQVFGAGDRDHRDRLFDGLSELVARESESRPVVLLFDDLQWADDSSAAALHYVARMSAGRPFLGILAARDTELGDNAAVRRAVRELRHADLLDDLPLEALPEAAVRELIATRVPGASSEPLSRVSGGNPLLAVELARAEV
ncbi:MAG: AAA family ATPase, partial [Gammaproteobacteria bacterium]|nr:AAA family ATPase [Gammaproteobacteria bacterium]